MNDLSPLVFFASFALSLVLLALWRFAAGETNWLLRRHTDDARCIDDLLKIAKSAREDTDKWRLSYNAVAQERDELRAELNDLKDRIGDLLDDPDDEE